MILLMWSVLRVLIVLRRFLVFLLFSWLRVLVLRRVVLEVFFVSLGGLLFCFKIVIVFFVFLFCGGVFGGVRYGLGIGKDIFEGENEFGYGEG